jgi:hypothetical protein
MLRARAVRRYSIEIKDTEGSVVFHAVACWDDKDKRIALAQITRLARLPEANFYIEPALAPQSGNSKQRPRPGTGRLDREPSWRRLVARASKVGREARSLCIEVARMAGVRHFSGLKSAV